MKTRILFWMASVAILGAGIAIINACSKTENVEKSNDFSVQNLSALNNYRPDKGEIATLYHQFLSEIRQAKEDASYKDLIEAVDRPVDEAVWLIETAVNTELGFYADSIDKTEELTVEITLSNKTYTAGGMPVIDGNEILCEYLEIESTIQANKENGYLFWCENLEIVEINSQNTVLEMNMIGGEEGGDAHYYTPLPPGTPIAPFPAGYWNYAGVPGGGMQYAEWDFYTKTCMPGVIRPAPGYIIEFYNSFYKSAYIGPQNCDDRLLADHGTAQTYILNTAMMNQYLYSSKEVIDENNPHPTNPDFFIGYYAFDSQDFDEYMPSCWSNIDPVPWFEHRIGFYIYELVWVGIPDK